MSKIRIIKKNDEYSSEYEVGDIFEIEGTWYGGVHITGKSGVPVSLDKDEYTGLCTEPVKSEDREEKSEGHRISGSAILSATLKESGFPPTHQNICIK